MASIVVELRVEMEDGATYDVVADQRDAARWEIQPFGCRFGDISARSMLGMRWLAWHALTRTGRITFSWEEFDAQCVEAGSMPVDVADPGSPAPSGAASSTSPR